MRKVLCAIMAVLFICGCDCERQAAPVKDQSQQPQNQNQQQQQQSGNVAFCGNCHEKLLVNDDGVVVGKTLVIDFMCPIHGI